MRILRPRFEVVAGTSSAAERRLVSADTVRALTGIPSSGTGAVTDTVLNLMIDAVLAQCATSCRLARGLAAPVTLAEEGVRATWPARTTYDSLTQCSAWYVDERRTQLILPWRAPITSIIMIENDIDLEENVDFQLLGAGVVQRLTSCWSFAEIIADYTAGFVPLADDAAYQEEGETLPADVVALIAEQVKYSASRPNPTLRSEDVPGIWSGTYNIPGGDAIDSSGLMRPLYDALMPYRCPLSFA